VFGSLSRLISSAIEAIEGIAERHIAISCALPLINGSTAGLVSSFVKSHTQLAGLLAVKWLIPKLPEIPKVDPGVLVPTPTDKIPSAQAQAHGMVCSSLKNPFRGSPQPGNHTGLFTMPVTETIIHFGVFPTGKHYGQSAP